MAATEAAERRIGALSRHLAEAPLLRAPTAAKARAAAAGGRSTSC